MLFRSRIFYLFIWLCWVFVSVRGLSLVVASGGHSSSWCAGLSLSRPLLLRGTGSRRAGSVVVAHGPSCSAACGIFPDQGLNPCPLHWQADSIHCATREAPLCILHLKISQFGLTSFQTLNSHRWLLGTLLRVKYWIFESVIGVLNCIYLF